MVTACCFVFRPRYFFLFLCYLQLLTLTARQTFDFFGHLWLCILINFITILIVIVGIFGGHQYRVGYISIYLLWQLVNITWNIFVICFYLDIGPYTQNNSGDYNLVNLGTGSRSWFEANGPLCKAIYNVSNLTDHIQLIKPVEVNGCYLDYRIIECVQAGIQILFALNSFFISFFLIYSFSRKPYSNNSYAHHQTLINNNHVNSMDAALPPYTISNTITPRSAIGQRSLRSVHSDFIHKSNNNRLSTRSTKSHRATNQRKQPPSYSNHSTATDQQLAQNNNYGTVGYNSNNTNNNNTYYNTYKSIRSYASNNQNSNCYNSKKYNSTTQLQPDSSSLDSVTMYGAQTNAAYYESRYSLHKSDKEPLPSTSTQNVNYETAIQPNYGYTNSIYDHNTYNTINNNTNNTFNSNNKQSNNIHLNNNNVQSKLVNNYNKHDSVYNIYSSNPYNTYGRSATRHPQRPSSFCSNASTSSNSLIFSNNNLIITNPTGTNHSTHSNHSTSHFSNHNLNARGSPIYMNSETRI